MCFFCMTRATTTLTSSSSLMPLNEKYDYYNDEMALTSRFLSRFHFSTCDMATNQTHFYNSLSFIF